MCSNLMLIYCRDPNRDVSQSSTDTASSAESTPLAKNREDREIPENGVSTPASSEASPRKKPRKQLL
jgi:hypothetical protein